MRTFYKAATSSLLSAALIAAPLFAQNPPPKDRDRPQSSSRQSSSRPDHSGQAPAQHSKPQQHSRPQAPQRPGPSRPQAPHQSWHRPAPPNYHGSYVRHNDWRRGYRLPPADWRRGVVITDYRYYHLQPPPVGYQWRYIDGNFVLAAVATGIITSVLIGALTH